MKKRVWAVNGKDLLLSIAITMVICLGIYMYNTWDQAVQVQDNQMKVKVYEKALTQLLIPHVSEASNTFYRSYITVEPSVELKDIQLRDMESEEEVIKIMVTSKPFMGPDIKLGEDAITFEIDSEGQITLSKFDHIKSYVIPHKFQELIISWPPKQGEYIQ